MIRYTLNQGTSNPGEAGFRGNTNQKLPVVNWLADLPETQQESDLVEVQFKNTRKGYYLNSNNIVVEKGDWVAVEATPGHDVGVVTITGRLVLLQIKKNNINMERYEVKRLYRKVRPMDMEKYEEFKAKEYATMIESRQITKELGLEMKIGDVEYQADGNKAIFYYIADGRVDFRQLIKVLADRFKTRIEMKQIGARQEAGRIGGIGPCGRELCCATWHSNFVTVSTSAARLQDISTNPLKLAGQCAKIKCCVNYEVPIYQDAAKKFPPHETILYTLEGEYYHIKNDLLKNEVTYATAPNSFNGAITLSSERAQEIIELNKKGEKPSISTKNFRNLKGEVEKSSVDYQNVVGQDSLTRFDKPKGKKKGGRRNNQPKARARQERGGDEKRAEGKRAEEPKQGRPSGNRQPRRRGRRTDPQAQNQQPQQSKKSE